MCVFNYEIKCTLYTYVHDKKKQRNKERDEGKKRETKRYKTFGKKGTIRDAKKKKKKERKKAKKQARNKE